MSRLDTTDKIAISSMIMFAVVIFLAGRYSVPDPLAPQECRAQEAPAGRRSAAEEKVVILRPPPPGPTVTVEEIPVVPAEDLPITPEGYAPAMASSAPTPQPSTPQPAWQSLPRAQAKPAEPPPVIILEESESSDVLRAENPYRH